MKQIRKPDFFVVGAPKSGTTSLYFYLKSHPEIFLPRRKELLFFCNDLYFTYPILNAQQFLDYYIDAENEKAMGEVSVWNLYSQNAAKNIFQFNPESKIIAIIRNPADALYSLHSNHVFNQNEIISDFAEAWKAVPQRKAGNKISPVIKCPVEGLYYTEIGKYAEQLQRYIDVFGKEKVKVILFDDFSSNAKDVYVDLLKFLDVDSTILPDFKIHNASKTYRSTWMRDLTVNAPMWLRKFGQTLFPHQSRGRDWLMKTLWQVNTKEADRKKMNPKLRQEILNHFLPDIQQLEKMTGRELSAWSKVQ